MNLDQVIFIIPSTSYKTYHTWDLSLYIILFQLVWTYESMQRC